MLKQAEKLFRHRLLNFELLTGKFQLDVGFDGGQLIGEVSHLFVLLQLRCHGFCTTERQAGDFV
ncbi:hypothetical protein D3C81_2027820 [compost metagenome]